MSVVLVTGSAGLVGGEAVQFFSEKGFHVVGIDNDMRKEFFGEAASTDWRRRELEETAPGYEHHGIDIRDEEGVRAIYAKYGGEIKLVIHAAAQPSHDWAARAPHTDFSINATGTLVLLESTRRYCPQAVFIFVSTNKVYGDNPNRLPLVEKETRWELAPRHPFFEHGIDESMSVDHATHSLFGASKLAADVLVQEYGRYFAMNTVCFRGGCLTGPGHSAAPLHGFLAYLVHAALAGAPYTIYGYKGKQVRDNLHAHDLANMFWSCYQDPRPGEVYNVGGGRRSNCSMQEAIALCEQLTGNKMNVSYAERHRVGDHIWYISDTRKFQRHYPDWTCEHDVPQILREIYDAASQRLRQKRSPEAGRRVQEIDPGLAD